MMRASTRRILLVAGMAGALTAAVVLIPRFRRKPAKLSWTEARACKDALEDITEAMDEQLAGHEGKVTRPSTQDLNARLDLPKGWDLYVAKDWPATRDVYSRPIAFTMRRGDRATVRLERERSALYYIYSDTAGSIHLNDVNDFRLVAAN